MTSWVGPRLSRTPPVFEIAMMLSEFLLVGQPLEPVERHRHSTDVGADRAAQHRVRGNCGHGERDWLVVVVNRQRVADVRIEVISRSLADDNGPLGQRSQVDRATIAVAEPAELVDAGRVQAGNGDLRLGLSTGLVDDRYRFEQDRHDAVHVRVVGECQLDERQRAGDRFGIQRRVDVAFPAGLAVDDCHMACPTRA